MMMGRIRTAAGAVALGLLSIGALACASGGGGGGDEGGAGTPNIQGSTITAGDLQATTYRSAYEVLRDNRLVEFQGNQMFLRGRGQTGFQGPAPMILVIDGTRIGTGAEGPLQSLQVEEIERIQILQQTEATSRFGTTAGGGAVVITTRRS